MEWFLDIWKQYENFSIFFILRMFWRSWVCGFEFVGLEMDTSTLKSRAGGGGGWRCLGRKNKLGSFFETHGGCGKFFGSGRVESGKCRK